MTDEIPPKGSPMTTLELDPPTPTPAEATEPRVTARTWWGFGAVIAATLLNILDSTVTNVAGPAIRADLGLSASMLEWVAASYTLALAVGLMTGARLGDMVGRKRVFMTGLAGFLLSSLLCSAAWSPATLVGGRVLQGLSAALVVPQCFGLLRDLFPGRLLGKAFGTMGPVIGLATVLGPVAAGLLINADLLGSGWRSMFWLNLPLGGFAMLVGARVLPSARPSGGVRLDLAGVALLAAASFMLVFPLVEGRSLDWPAWVLGVLVAALPVFAVFAAQQRRRLRTGRHPLVEVSVLRKRSYASGVAFVMVFFGVIVGFSLTVGLFLQIGLGFSPLEASLYLAALAVGTFFGSGVGAWAATNVGRPILHVGLTLMAVGATVLLVSLHGVDPASYAVPLGRLLPGLAVFGLGMGMIFVPLFGIVMGEVDDHEVGSASGLLTSVEQLGASLGVAVLGTVFFGVLRLEDGGPVAAIAAGRHLTATEHTLGWVLGLIAVAWAVGWLLPRRGKVGMH